MNYFIADIHFGHQNALAYDNRPFTSVEANDAAIISNWNNVVNIDDYVYILGDISYHNVTKTIEILKKLNGHKILVVGNHDQKFLKNNQFRNEFIEICYYKELDIEGGNKLILSHYPIVAFNGQFRGGIHLYGHVHNSQQWNMVEHFKRISEEERGAGTCRMFNVGCMLDYMKFTPRTLDEILKECEGVYKNTLVERNQRTK